MPEFFDSHAHVTSDTLWGEADAAIERARGAGLVGIINICTDQETLRRGLELRQKYPWVYNAAGIHPHDASQDLESYFSQVSTLAKSGDLAAIGETGLDYHYNNSDPASQKELLKRHFELALQTSLPVAIHCREAFADFFSILDAFYTVNGKHAPGVLHCFTGTQKEAEGVLERGWHLSISGIATFKKSEELRAVAKMTPIDRLLIETDAPYLAPQSHRGKQNEPSYVTEVAATIATVKGISIEEVATATTANARHLFNLRNNV